MIILIPAGLIAAATAAIMWLHLRYAERSGL